MELIQALSICLLVLKVHTIYFEPSSKTITIARYWFKFICFTSAVIGCIFNEYEVISATHKPSYLACVTYKMPLMTQIPMVLILIGFICVWISFILFALKSVRNVTLERNPAKYEKVRNVMEGIFRQCILFGFFTLSVVLKFILWNVSYLRDNNLEPFVDMIQGFTLYFFFKFGTRKYLICCGCCHKYLIGKWDQRNSEFLETITTECRTMSDIETRTSISTRLDVIPE
eukprot:4006_1